MKKIIQGARKVLVHKVHKWWLPMAIMFGATTSCGPGTAEPTIGTSSALSGIYDQKYLIGLASDETSSGLQYYFKTCLLKVDPKSRQRINPEPDNLSDHLSDNLSIKECVNTFKDAQGEPLFLSEEEFLAFMPRRSERENLVKKNQLWHDYRRSQSVRDFGRILAITTVVGGVGVAENYHVMMHRLSVATQEGTGGQASKILAHRARNARFFSTPVPTSPEEGLKNIEDLETRFRRAGLSWEHSITPTVTSDELALVKDSILSDKFSDFVKKKLAQAGELLHSKGLNPAAMIPENLESLLASELYTLHNTALSIPNYHQSMRMMIQDFVAEGHNITDIIHPEFKERFIKFISWDHHFGGMLTESLATELTERPIETLRKADSFVLWRGVPWSVRKAQKTHIRFTQALNQTPRHMFEHALQQSRHSDVGRGRVIIASLILGATIILATDHHLAQRRDQLLEEGTAGMSGKDLDFMLTKLADILSGENMAILHPLRQLPRLGEFINVTLPLRGQNRVAMYCFPQRQRQKDKVAASCKRI